MKILKVPLKSLVVIFAVVLVALTVACSVGVHTRTCKGIIISYNTVKTFDGNVWQYNHHKPLSSVVDVTFNTNATNDVTDDTIIDIK